MKRLLIPAFFVAFAAGPSASRAQGGSGAGGPIVKGPWMQHVTATSAVVRVEVDPPAPVTLELGAGSARGGDSGAPNVLESREIRALHSIVLSDLVPATRYTFTVKARGAQKHGALTTAPPDASGAAFRFLVYGDNRSDDAAHAAVVRAMTAAPSDFLVHTGDFVERGASASQWQTFFEIESPLLRERCLFSAVGNHELVDGAGVEYVRYFGPSSTAVADARPATLSLEQLSGTYRWSNARFFLVNGMVDYTAGPTRAWLEKALTDADREAGLVWRIVVVHHGVRSSGPHGDNAHLAEARIPDLFRAHHIDLVIAGHDHVYERGVDDGLAYLVSGGGGAPTYRVKKAQATSRHYESVRHFVQAAVADDAIQLTAIRVDGSTIEHCALRKASAWDCDEGPPAAALDGGPSLSAEPPVTSRSKCGCDVIGSPRGTPSALACVVLGGATLLARRRRRPLAEGSPGRAVNSATTCDDPAMRKMLGLAVVALSLGACTTYRDQLARGQQSFEKNEYEQTLGQLRVLEADLGHLDTPEQAKYAYVRGMTDYRVGYRADARHWLSIARAYDDATPGTLPAAWKTRMNDALDEMNAVVYSAGLAALATTRKPGEDNK